MKSSYLKIILVTAGLLAGCSGVKETSTTSTAPLAKVTITADNSETVAKAALGTATQDVGGSSLRTVAVQTTTLPTDDDSRILHRLTDFALQKMEEQQNSTAMMVAGATTTLGCLTISTDGTANIPATYLTLSFSNCPFGTGATLNGSLGLSAISRPTVDSLQGTVSINLTVTRTSLPTLTLVGGYTVSAEKIGSTTRTNTLAGSSLVFSIGTLSDALTDFSFSSTYDGTVPVPTTNTYNDTVGYTVSSGFTGGSFTFATTSTIVRNSTEIYPHAGVAVISGAGTAKLRITALGNENAPVDQQVKIEFSADGITYGTPSLYTWAQLQR